MNRRIVIGIAALVLVACALAAHAPAGDPLKLPVDERRQPGERGLVAGSPRQQEPGHAA